MSLRPCVGCGRHVREDACPFCGTTLAPVPALTDLGRRSRAALVAGALGVTALGGASACHSPATAVYGGPPVTMDQDAAPTASPSTTPTTSSSASTVPSAPITAYGGPPTAPPQPSASTKGPK